MVLKKGWDLGLYTPKVLKIYSFIYLQRKRHSEIAERHSKAGKRGEKDGESRI